MTAARKRAAEATARAAAIAHYRRRATELHEIIARRDATSDEVFSAFLARLAVDAAARAELTDPTPEVSR